MHCRYWCCRCSDGTSSWHVFTCKLESKTKSPADLFTTTKCLKTTLTNKYFQEFLMYFHGAHIKRWKVTCVPCDIPLTLLYCLETRKQSTVHETIRIMKVQQQQQHCGSATCLYHQQTPQARVGLIWGCVTDTGVRWDWFSRRLFALQQSSKCSRHRMILVSFVSGCIWFY